MKDYIEIGSSPCDEDCVQLGSEDYTVKALCECKRFINLLRKVFGDEPDGARLVIKGFEHDFGRYYEVVCYFDDEKPGSTEYAFKLEANTPATWSI
jgi:hypothetical protein